MIGRKRLNGLQTTVVDLQPYGPLGQHQERIIQQRHFLNNTSSISPNSSRKTFNVNIAHLLNKIVEIRAPSADAGQLTLFSRSRGKFVATTIQQLTKAKINGEVYLKFGELLKLVAGAGEPRVALLIMDSLVTPTKAWRNT